MWLIWIGDKARYLMCVEPLFNGLKWTFITLTQAEAQKLNRRFRFVDEHYGALKADLTTKEWPNANAHLKSNIRFPTWKRPDLDQNSERKLILSIWRHVNSLVKSPFKEFVFHRAASSFVHWINWWWWCFGESFWHKVDILLGNKISPATHTATEQKENVI